jgi:hypothetical protein
LIVGRIAMRPYTKGFVKIDKIGCDIPALEAIGRDI